MRISDQLTHAVRERHPTVMVFRDRTTMDQLFALIHLDGFVKPRVSERTRRRLRPVMWTFLTAVVLLGCIPARFTLASPAGTAGWWLRERVRRVAVEVEAAPAVRAGWGVGLAAAAAGGVPAVDPGVDRVHRVQRTGRPGPEGPYHPDVTHTDGLNI